MRKGYRILSVEAADIYKQEQENGVAVGYRMPEDKSDACFRLLKVLLDASLDSTELEKAYKRICRKKFSFSDKFGNAYFPLRANAPAIFAAVFWNRHSKRHICAVLLNAIRAKLLN